MPFHHRIIIEPIQTDAPDVRYKIKISNLPVPDGPWDGTTQTTTAIHAHEVLLELLTGAFGSREAAQRMLSDVNAEGPKEGVIKDQPTTASIDKLKRNS